MALAAGIAGAELIPDGSELFLGFTSTQKAGLGPRRIANLETLGYTDPRLLPPRHAHAPLAHHRGPRRPGTSTSTSTSASATVFRPGMQVPEGTQTVRAGPARRSSTRRRAPRLPPQRHDRATRPRSRRPRGSTATSSAPTGRVYPKGTAVPHRADFNTLDNPFFWSANPRARRQADAADGGRALRRLQPDERRLPPQPARDGRRAAGRDAAAVRAAATAARASTPCSRRRTARTSSSRRGGTARSRSSSC